MLRCAAASLLLPGALAGCSRGYGALAVQLPWIRNVQFAGEYFAAKRGYYRQAGFSSVELIAGGARGTSVEDAVVSGRAFCGITSPTATAPAILEGAALTILGATYQKNPFCILSLADDPIPSPEAMSGKRIGVQGGRNEVIFTELLRANHLGRSEVRVVPVEYDPAVLVDGVVDGFMSFITNEPILLRSQGHEVVTFLLADHGLPFVSETYTVRKDAIRTEREKTKAFLLTQVKGWRDSVASPEASVRLAVNDFGKDLELDPGQQIAEARAQNQLIVTADTRTHGLLTMTDALVESNIEVLRRIGVPITARQLFDRSLLEEVYDEHPDLRTVP